MKLIIFFILFTLNFINHSNAEMIQYLCNFKEGSQMEGGKEYPLKKMPVLKIILDKDKKVIRDIKRQFDPYTEDKEVVNWKHNWDSWSDSYSLNFSNGNLELNGQNKSQDWTKSYRYVCAKLEKKPIKN